MMSSWSAEVQTDGMLSMVSDFYEQKSVGLKNWG